MPNIDKIEKKAIIEIVTCGFFMYFHANRILTKKQKLNNIGKSAFHFAEGIHRIN